MRSSEKNQLWVSDLGRYIAFASTGGKNARRMCLRPDGLFRRGSITPRCGENRTLKNWRAARERECGEGSVRTYSRPLQLDLSEAFLASAMGTRLVVRFGIRGCTRKSLRNRQKNKGLRARRARRPARR